MRTRVCYVLPLYDEATEQHYAHIYRLLERAGRELDLLVIAEKSKGPIRLKNVSRAWRQRFRFPPLRALEMVLMLLCARLMGYRTFYTHYSFYGGIFAGIIARLTGGRSFYWNCEENIAHHVGLTSLANLRKLLLTQWPETTAIRLAKPLVTGTERMRDYYAKHYGLGRENIRVMPNWVDLRRFVEAQPDEELRTRLDEARGGPRVLYLHRLAPRKGAHHLGTIAGRVTEDHPRALFVIDPEGTIRYSYVSPVGENPGVDGVLEALAQMHAGGQG
jgi:glycosyltransferase involved in cell wall biosynthesis